MIESIIDYALFKSTLHSCTVFCFTRSYAGNFFLNYFKETEVSFSVPQTLFLGRQCYGKTILGENECVL